MDVLLQTYYILLPIVATALIGWVGYILEKQHKKEKKKEQEWKEEQEAIANIRKANSEGIMLVLRYMLKRYHTEYVVQGKISYEQHQEWRDIFAAYKALGGNSMAENWNEDVESMDKHITLDGSTSVFEAMLKENLERNKQKNRD